MRLLLATESSSLSPDESLSSQPRSIYEWQSILVTASRAVPAAAVTILKE